MKEQVDVRNHAYRNNERNRKLQDSVQLYIFLLSFIYLLPNFHLQSQLSNLIYLVSVTEHIGLCSIIYYIPLAEEQFDQVPQDFIDGPSLVWSNLIEKQIEDRSGFSTGISISPVWRPPSLSVLQLAPCWSLSICLTFRTDSSVFPKHTLYQKHFWDQQPLAELGMSFSSFCLRHSLTLQPRVTLTSLWSSVCPKTCDSPASVPQC